MISGQFKQEDYFDNVGGINLADSPFKVKREQALLCLNASYIRAGGFKKRNGHSKINSVADAQLNTLGLDLHNSSSASSKSVIRAAGTKLQLFDTSTPSFTNLTEDTASAGSTFLNSSSTQPVTFSQFNTSNADVLWGTGGGMSGIYGVYSTTKVTKNGSDTPTGSISTAVSATGGSFSATGTYYYAVALRKASTQAISNAALDVSATISATTDKVTITLSSLTGVDATKYDKIYIYRSAVSGVTAFTAGDLVTTVNTGTASYVDTGTSTTSSTTVPRAGLAALDNSVLPSGTYNTSTVFKRRLVTAANSTIYLSDTNKSESWPTANTITIPSGGPITALSVLSFTSVGSNTIDEILCIHKESELWVITGNNTSDWVLKFIDKTGCPGSALPVVANGYLAWVNYRGVYLWDGTGKPIYCSRTIEPLFARNGDLVKTQLYLGHGELYEKENIVVWYLSHATYGTQKFQIKLDLRLTLSGIDSTLTGRVLEGVFLFDTTTFPIYASKSYLPSNGDETLLIGDSSGFAYKAYFSDADAGANYEFKYTSNYLDQGNANLKKRYHYVVAWVDKLGDWNINLDYWTDYRTGEAIKSIRSQPIDLSAANSAALWDMAYWDLASWDDWETSLTPLIFVLGSDTNNNNEGKCIKIQFRHSTMNQPVSILGYSVLYTDASFTGVKS